MALWFQISYRDENFLTRCATVSFQEGNWSTELEKCWCFNEIRLLKFSKYRWQIKASFQTDEIKNLFCYHSLLRALSCMSIYKARPIYFLQNLTFEWFCTVEYAILLQCGTSRQRMSRFFDHQNSREAFFFLLYRISGTHFNAEDYCVLFASATTEWN